MILWTHNPTPKERMHPIANILFKIGISIVFLLFLTMFSLLLFACIYYANSIIGAIIVLIAFFFLISLIIILPIDMNKAYIEINEHDVRAVDYIFFIKREKTIAISEISSATRLHLPLKSNYFPKTAGLRFILYTFISSSDKYYIELRNSKNDELFVVYGCPASEKAFAKYLNQ